MKQIRVKHALKGPDKRHETNPKLEAEIYHRFVVNNLTRFKIG